MILLTCLLQCLVSRFFHGARCPMHDLPWFSKAENCSVRENLVLALFHRGPKQALYSIKIFHSNLFSIWWLHIQISLYLNTVQTKQLTLTNLILDGKCTPSKGMGSTGTSVRSLVMEQFVAKVYLPPSKTEVMEQFVKRVNIPPDQTESILILGPLFWDTVSEKNSYISFSPRQDSQICHLDCIVA